VSPAFVRRGGVGIGEGQHRAAYLSLSQFRQPPAQQQQQQQQQQHFQQWNPGPIYNSLSSYPQIQISTQLPPSSSLHHPPTDFQSPTKATFSSSSTSSFEPLAVETNPANDGDDVLNEVDISEDPEAATAPPVQQQQLQLQVQQSQPEQQTPDYLAPQFQQLQAVVTEQSEKMRVMTEYLNTQQLAQALEMQRQEGMHMSEISNLNKVHGQQLDRFRLSKASGVKSLTGGGESKFGIGVPGHQKAWDASNQPLGDYLSYLEQFTSDASILTTLSKQEKVLNIEAGDDDDLDAGSVLTLNGQ
jgi:hypothetical protein